MKTIPTTEVVEAVEAAQIANAKVVVAALKDYPTVSCLFMALGEVVNAVVNENLHPAKLASGLIKLIELSAPKYTSMKLTLCKILVEELLNQDKGR